MMNSAAEQPENDPLESLFEHIKFLKRFSSKGLQPNHTMERNGNNSDIVKMVKEDEDEDGRGPGLHPGLFATLPFELITSTDDTEDETCCLCDHKLLDVSHQVLLCIPVCGHRVHHECGRKWFQANKACPGHECEVVLETPRILERAEIKAACEPHSATFKDVEDLLHSVLSYPDTPKVELEFDGVYQPNSASCSLRSCAGKMTITIDELERLHYDGDFDSDKFLSLICNFYQGTMTLRATMAIPMRKTNFATPLTRSLWLKKNSWFRSSSSSSHSTSCSSITSMEDEKKEEESMPEPQEMRAPTPPPRSITPSLPPMVPVKVVPHQQVANIEQQQECHFTEFSRKASNPKIVLRNMKTSIAKAFSNTNMNTNRPKSRLIRYDSQPKPFQKLYNFSLRGGMMFQTTCFENAVKLCGGGQPAANLSNPQSRILYM